MISEYIDEFNNPPQDDLLLTGTTRKWIKFKNCMIRGETIRPEGPSETYSPFDKYPGILIDFLKLVQKFIKLNSGTLEFWGMQRKSRKAKNKFQSLKKDVLEEYRKFILNYGILGVGLNRILDVNKRTVNKVTGSITSSVHIKSLLIKGKPDADDPLRPYVDISLPECGGEVSIEDWNKAFGGLTWKDYRETLTQLMDCEMIWDIIEDMESEKQGNIRDFRFNTDGVCVTSINDRPEFSWEFSSLIQAISIMYGSNKAGKFGTRVILCPACGKLSTTTNKAKIFCGLKCKEVISKRKLRNRKAEVKLTGNS